MAAIAVGTAPVKKSTQQPVALPPLAKAVVHEATAAAAAAGAAANNSVEAALAADGVVPVVTNRAPAAVEVATLASGKLQYSPSRFHPENFPHVALTVAIGNDSAVSDDRGPSSLIASMLQAQFVHSGRGCVFLRNDDLVDFYRRAGVPGGYIYTTWNEVAEQKLENFLKEQEHRKRLSRVDPSVSTKSFIVFDQLSLTRTLTHGKLFQKVIDNIVSLDLHVFFSATGPMDLPPTARAAVKGLVVHRQDSKEQLEKIQRIWFDRIPYHHFQQLVEQITRSVSGRTIVWDGFRHEIRWFLPNPDLSGNVQVGEREWRAFSEAHFMDQTKPIALSMMRDKLYAAKQQLDRLNQTLARMIQLPTYDHAGRERVWQEYQAIRNVLPTANEIEGRIGALTGPSMSGGLVINSQHPPPLPVYQYQQQQWVGQYPPAHPAPVPQQQRPSSPVPTTSLFAPLPSLLPPV